MTGNELAPQGGQISTCKDFLHVQNGYEEIALSKRGNRQGILNSSK
jgi:hypothetical protein